MSQPPVIDADDQDSAKGTTFTRNPTRLSAARPAGRRRRPLRAAA